MFELVHSPLHPSDVEVHVMRKVCAHTGLGVAEGAVERSPAHTDHHGSQAQQEEEQPGVPAYLICISGVSNINIESEHDQCEYCKNEFLENNTGSYRGPGLRQVLGNGLSF